MVAIEARPDNVGGWAAFRHRDFVLYGASRFLSALAIQMQNVGVGWLVYDLTRDPLALGLVGLAGVRAQWTGIPYNVRDDDRRELARIADHEAWSAPISPWVREAQPFRPEA